MSGPLVFALAVVMLMVVGPVVTMRMQHRRHARRQNVSARALDQLRLYMGNVERRKKCRTAADVAADLGVPLLELLTRLIPRLDARVAPGMAPDPERAQRHKREHDRLRLASQEMKWEQERRAEIEDAKAARWRAGNPVTPERPVDTREWMPLYPSLPPGYYGASSYYGNYYGATSMPRNPTRPTPF